MSYALKLTLETLAVGVATAVIGSFIALALMYTEADFKLSEYRFWWKVALAYFLTGAGVHLLAEVSGVNRWYRLNGAAAI